MSARWALWACSGLVAGAAQAGSASAWPVVGYSLDEAPLQREAELAERLRAQAHEGLAARAPVGVQQFVAAKSGQRASLHPFAARSRRP